MTGPCDLNETSRRARELKAQQAIKEGHIAEERDRLDHAEATGQSSDFWVADDVLHEYIADDIRDLEFHLGQLKDVPPSTQITLEMHTHGITAIVEELKK